MRILRVLRQKTMPLCYILIVIVAVLSYFPAREVIIAQTAWVWVVRSDITLNFVILLFVFGLLCNKLTKNMSKRKGWLIWGIGLTILMLVLRFLGGMPTIFG